MPRGTAGDASRRGITAPPPTAIASNSPAITNSLRLMLSPPPADNYPQGTIGRRGDSLELQGVRTEQLQTQARGVLRAALTRAAGSDVLGVQHRGRRRPVAGGDPPPGGGAARCTRALCGARRPRAGAGRAGRAFPLSSARSGTP